MTLTPPAHICGEFTSGVPSSIRRERYEWITAAKDAGHSLSEISAALGLWRFAAGRIINRGLPKRETKARTKPARKKPMHKPVMPCRNDYSRVDAVIYTRTAGPFSHALADVTLVRAPWDAPTATPDPRPETAPPRGIKSKRNGVTPEGFIAILRAECLKARMGA